MEDLKNEKLKHRVVRDSDISPSPMVHGNVGEVTLPQLYKCCT